ncbi:tRNA 2-thiouridine(34) synthase MnmA [Candidatus Collierbacteria bacterium RIFOXYD1_FULL_40_9]|uniref:tRNA-specific 2-thiouridylase MnmA n=1 Tax=Candidatus Collierbacteria bacterium RIFOXYD1_FULL_40_9 TaxID=1817731 RepID=A0A1F5FT89_9BACT|nr:MAG: tRNA 2-thiouridine(34) synthase MnmA [Candidatus Collierbacteria bacterium RIFOXYD1_FULL_40_9]
MKKVAVGLSGGVDSAVSALLLKRKGFEVVGVHLYCWPPKSEIEKDGVTREEWIKKNGCRADEDRTSALKAALEIGIPFKELDFSEEYNDRVIKYFYDEYEAGRTPNPDVLCNSEIKFGLFLDWALENGFDYIATGHYARLVSPDQQKSCSHDPTFAGSEGVSARDLLDQVKLYIPNDKHKDQTYFLWKLTEKEFKHVIFPLGDLLKSEVREVAKKAGLSVANKKDSQGICFVGNVEVSEFLKRRLLEKPGEVMDTSGNVIGKHRGVAFYTIGERGGWTMDPSAQKLQTSRTQDGDITKIYYVVDKDAFANRLIVGDKTEVMSNKISIENISLINHSKDGTSVILQKLTEDSELFVRIRHGGEILKIQKLEKSKTSYFAKATRDKQNNHISVETEKEVFGVASGQSAVFYSGAGECLGGGVIV